MRRISNSDLLTGLTCPYLNVQNVYLKYALKKWLTSKNYGPQTYEEISKLRSSLSKELQIFVSGEIFDVLPKLIAVTKGLDFAKIDLLLQYNWGNDTFHYKIAYASLLNLDAYPNAGFNRLPKKTMVEKMQKVLSKTQDLYDWYKLFDNFAVSATVLAVFANCLKKFEKESRQDFDVIVALSEKAEDYPQYAKEMFNISLYILKNFIGSFRIAVRCLDDFCQNFPMFQKPLENFLLKNFDRYFLNPYEYRISLQYYREMVMHLSNDGLHFPISWKMKIMQKMFRENKDAKITTYLLSSLNAIYDYSIENVDEVYYDTLVKLQRQKLVKDEVVFEAVQNFSKISIFKASSFEWKKFAEYPLPWQKAMLMAYTLPDLPEAYLAQAYFALVFMHQKNSSLFDDFENLASEILAKKWKVEKQDLRNFFEPFQWSPYDETTFSYLQRGFKKLLSVAEDRQVGNLMHLKYMIPLYAKVIDEGGLKEKIAEIEERQAQKREKQEKEIAFLLAKLPTEILL